MKISKLRRTEGHVWHFARSGGVDQVILRNGSDIANLRELDLKLWMALSMPVRGSNFDGKTAAMLDEDGDGRLRPRELLNAIDWAVHNFRDLDVLLVSGDEVSLCLIKNQDVHDAAVTLVHEIGKSEPVSVTMSDVSLRYEAFSGSPFNGDGIIPPSIITDEALRSAVTDILSCVGSKTDAGGEEGLDRALFETFIADAQAYTSWWETGQDVANVLGGMKTARAHYELYESVREKIADYFMRCALTGYEPRASAQLSASDDTFRSLSPVLLSDVNEDVMALPLAAITTMHALPLDSGLNPAWRAIIQKFATDIAEPLFGGAISELTRDGWNEIQKHFEGFSMWVESCPATALYSLCIDRIRELCSEDVQNGMNDLFIRDEAFAHEMAQIALVEKLVRIRRDLYSLLTNYVNFSSFYSSKMAVFQAGVLYIDARACSLCIEVADESKHAILATLSGMCLAYCALKRPGGKTKNLVAAITAGDSDNLMVGRNGVFIDNDGLDWDATITRLVSNPISVREAFWSPYKKFARMIEEQIAKRAQQAEADRTLKLGSTAAAMASADTFASNGSEPLPIKKIDLGTIALIGTAIGGVSALVAGFLQVMFGLGWFLPLGFLGLLLVISGPSMTLASLKLRKRNLAPLLDANGWAINTKARINIPFGASLTDLASLPVGSVPSLADPYAEKRKIGRWVVLGVVVFIGALYLVWRFGLADRYLPESIRYVFFKV